VGEGQLQKSATEYSSEGAAGAGALPQLPSREVPHPVAVHGRVAELVDELVVGHCAHSSPDYGHELGHFGQVDVVAVFLLEGAPVELLGVEGQAEAVGVPVGQAAVGFVAGVLAAEGELEDVE
jgi:hypothetical protein